MAQKTDQTTYHNPVIPGFHPDPSVCRVGEDYYLVTSSFEFFPGVPIFHSKDIVNWEQIGHCLTRESQLPLSHAPASGGIYAPVIRYNKGVFYMITTNVSGKGNFFVTTTDPAGEWSDPVWLDQGGIDPSLLFDEDGKVYLASNGGPDGIYQSEIDIKTGKRLTDIRQLWTGTGGRWPEGPHLYKIRDWYYLMIAEGGTEYGHKETIARSKSPWGPFEAFSGNPILTHSNKIAQFNPIQGTGHAELVEAHDGSWWLMFLAFRPVNGQFHHLGRETFLAPVSWNNEGWPVVNQNGTVAIDMQTKTLPLHPFAAKPVREGFNGEKLPLEWNYIRNPKLENYSLTSKKGWLLLRGTDQTLDSIGTPTFIGRRQEQFNCEASCLMEFTSKPGQESGITAYMNDRHHYEVGIGCDEKGKYVFSRFTVGHIKQVQSREYIKTSRVILRIKADPVYYSMEASVDEGKSFFPLGKAETKYLSSEVAGGFTGVYFGLYCTGNGSTAHYGWFEYNK